MRFLSKTLITSFSLYFVLGFVLFLRVCVRAKGSVTTLSFRKRIRNVNLVIFFFKARNLVMMCCPALVGHGALRCMWQKKERKDGKDQLTQKSRDKVTHRRRRGRRSWMGTEWVRAKSERMESRWKDIFCIFSHLWTIWCASVISFCARSV